MDTPDTRPRIELALDEHWDEVESNIRAREALLASVGRSLDATDVDLLVYVASRRARRAAEGAT